MIYVDRSYGWDLFSIDDLWDTFGYGLISNVLPDFVSLVETRYILRLMQRTNSASLHFLGILVDFVLTSAIALLPLI
jgi:hypothetical protein